MLCHFGSLQKLLPTFATTFLQSGLYTFIHYSVISFHNNGDIFKISSIVIHCSSPCIAWYLGAFGNCRVLSFLGGGVGLGWGEGTCPVLQTHMKCKTVENAPYQSWSSCWVFQGFQLSGRGKTVCQSSLSSGKPFLQPVKQQIKVHVAWIDWCTIAVNIS